MIQKLKLSRSQPLTKTNIQDLLQKARAGNDYCSFQLKFGTYIKIAFFRDNTYDICTNIRNLALWQEINYVRLQRGLPILTDYVFKWIQVYNR